MDRKRRWVRDDDPQLDEGVFRALAAGTGDGAADELLFGAAAVLALGAAALAALELRLRRRDVPVDRLRRALRLVRESAARAPVDRRRALDHLAATLGDVPPAERATRLAWSVLDCSLIESTFGIRPKHWRDELRHVMRWMSDMPAVPFGPAPSRVPFKAYPFSISEDPTRLVRTKVANQS